MINLRHFIKRLRTLTILVASLIFFLSVLLPPLIGIVVRQQLINAVVTLDEARLAAFDIDTLTAEATQVGWFSSVVRISASGTIFSADGQSLASRSGMLRINHGPVIWHLSDSLLALAELQLEPAVPAPELTQHFSGSAIARLTPGLQVHIDAIAGINASGGEHWAELRMTAPPLIAGTPHYTVWLDLDSQALAAAGWQDHVAGWLQHADARTSNNRLLFSISAQ